MWVVCGVVLALVLLLFMLSALTTWAATTMSPMADTADEEGLD